MEKFDIGTFLCNKSSLGSEASAPSDSKGKVDRAIFSVGGS
mgnify:CR=1 FL=1